MILSLIPKVMCRAIPVLRQKEYRPNSKLYISEDDFLEATSLKTAIACVNSSGNEFEILADVLDLNFLDVDLIRDSNGDIKSIFGDLKSVLFDYARYGRTMPLSDRALSFRSTRPIYQERYEVDESGHPVVVLPYLHTHDDNQSGIPPMLCVGYAEGEPELGDFEWHIVRGEAVITKWENEAVIIPPTDLLLCYHDYTAIWECIVWGLFNSTYQLRRSDRGKLSVCASTGCEQLVFGKLKKFCGSKCKNRTNVALWRANNNQQ